MAQKVYKIFMVKMKEAWYQLSQEEQDGLVSRNFEKVKEFGGKTVVACDSSWSSEQCEYFGLEEFPDIEAAQKYAAYLNQVGWLRYIDSTTFLGTEWQAA